MTETSRELEPIRNHFKVTNKAKFFVEYNCPGASVADHIYGISSVGIFKIGLLPAVLKVMKTVGIPYEIDVEVLREFMPLKTNNIEPVIKDLPCEENFEEREYQTEAVGKLLKHGRGVIVLPTASGKSFVIAKTLYSLLHSSDKIKHCLILVPSTNLVIQFYKDLLDYGLSKDDVSMFSSKNKKCQDTGIIISNRQWLGRHLDELPYIDVLFVDECHVLGAGNKLSKMVAGFSTNIRFGCTATLPNDIENKWNVVGLIGPVLYKQSIIDMQDKKFISNLSVTSLRVFDEVIDKDTKCLFSMRRTVSSDDIQVAYENERKHIVDQIKRLYEPVIDHVVFYTEGTNTLFLFDFIPFGENLYELIKTGISDNRNVVYIDGRTSIDDRERIRNIIETEDNTIIVAQSACFGTGINIKRLHNLVFAFNSKSSTKIIQSIGRILRKHPSKTCVNLFDINMNYKYSRRHFNARKLTYKDIYGLEIDTKVTFNV